MEIGIKTGEKTPVEIVNEIKNGCNIEYIKIDGMPVGILGTTSEEDKDAALKVLNEAYNSSGGDISKMISAIYLAAQCTENKIEPTKQIEVDGYNFMLDIPNLKAYTMDGDEIISCPDLNTEDGLLPDLPDTAVEAILKDRLRLWLRTKDTDVEEDVFEINFM